MGKFSQYSETGRPGGRFAQFAEVQDSEKQTTKLESFLEGLQTGEGWGFRDEAAGGREVILDRLPDWADPLYKAATSGQFSPGIRAGTGIGHALGGLVTESRAPEGSKAADVYRDKRDEIRMQEDIARADNPWSFGAGEITGSVASTPVPAMGGAKAAATGAKVIGSAARPGLVKTAAKATGSGLMDFLKTLGGGAMAGGTFGAVSGAGNADEGVQERVHGAAAGGMEGTLWGAALAPPLRYVAGPVIGAIGRKLMTTSDQKAMDMVLKRMQRSGISLEDAHAQFKTWAKTGDVPETLAEFMGPNEKGLLSALVTSSRETRSKAGKVLLGRGRDEVDRLEGRFADSMGAGRGDFKTAKAAAAKARVEDPEPLYANAHFETIDGQSFLKRMPTRSFGLLGKLIRNSEEAQKAVQKAATYADTMRLPAIRDELRKFHGIIKDGGQISTMPNLSVQAADFIERQINRRLDLSMKGAVDDVPAGLRTLRDGVREIIDPLGVGEARATAAERIRRGQLLDEGRKFMHKNVDVEDIENVLRGDPALEVPAASPEGQAAYVTGAARAVSDELRNVADMKGFADATRKIARTPAIREKVDAVRPKVLTKKGTENRGSRQTKANQRLDEEIERVADRADFTNEMLGNSWTAFRQNDVAESVAEDGLFGHLGDLLQDLIIAGPEGAKAGLRARFGDRAKNTFTQPGVLNPGINRAASDLLLSTGDDILPALNQLAARRSEVAGRRNLPVLPQLAGHRIGGFFGGREGALADPYAQDFDTAYAEDATKADAIMLDLMRDATPEEQARIRSEYERLMPYMSPEEQAAVQAVISQ